MWQQFHLLYRTEKSNVTKFLTAVIYKRNRIQWKTLFEIINITSNFSIIVHSLSLVNLFIVPGPT